MKTENEGGAPAPRLDHTTRLAFERTFLAHERTLMGWVRTALALISFGYTIAKFFGYLRGGQGAEPPLVDARTMGVLMIVTGLVSLGVADLQHRRSQAQLRKVCPELPTSLAGITAAAIALMGLLALFGAILRT